MLTHRSSSKAGSLNEEVEREVTLVGKLGNEIFTNIVESLFAFKLMLQLYKIFQYCIKYFPEYFKEIIMIIELKT